MTLDQVESDISHQLPLEYRLLASRGQLLGPCAIWLFDARWLPPEEMETLLTPAGERLLSFAVSAAYDRWCWHVTPGTMTILDCQRDDIMARVYAPSFAGFLFRRALDFAAGGYDDVSVARVQLLQWADVFQDLLPNRWSEVLRKGASREESFFRQGRYDCSQLIPRAEAHALLLTEWQFEALDATVVWQ